MKSIKIALTSMFLILSSYASAVEISRLYVLDSFITESLSKPTTRVIFGLIDPAVKHIFSSIDVPPILWRDFALFDFILEPSPAARTIVWMSTVI